MLNILTEKQRKLMYQVKQEWLDKIFNKRLNLNKEKAKKGIEWLYNLSKLSKPKIVFLKSPLACQYYVNIISKIKKDKLKEVGKEVWEEVGREVRKEVWEELWEEVGKEVGKEVRDEVGKEMRDEVGEEVGEEVMKEVWDEVMKEVRNRVRDEVWEEVMKEVRDEVGDEVWEEVGKEVWEEVRNRVRDEVGDEVMEEVWDELVRIEELKYYQFSFYGNIWDYGWCSFYDYFTRIGIVNNSKFNKFVELLNTGIYDMVQLDKLCVVCELPIKIKRLNTKLHSETGVAIEWSDGYKLYFLEGINFNEKLYWSIINKTADPKDIMKIENTDQRAMAIKYYGAEKLIEELGGKELDKKEYSYGTDYLIELKDFKDGLEQPYKFIKGYDPSKQEYVYVRTHPSCKTVEEAHNFCYRLDSLQLSYNPKLRT